MGLEGRGPAESHRRCWLRGEGGTVSARCRLPVWPWAGVVGDVGRACGVICIISPTLCVHLTLLSNKERNQERVLKRKRISWWTFCPVDSGGRSQSTLGSGPGLSGRDSELLCLASSGAHLHSLSPQARWSLALWRPGVDVTMMVLFRKQASLCHSHPRGAPPPPNPGGSHRLPYRQSPFLQGLRHLLGPEDGGDADDHLARPLQDPLVAGDLGVSGHITHPSTLLLTTPPSRP